MGRATRWLMSLFRGKRESRDRREIPSDDQRREKRRWSFRSSRESVDSASRFPPAKATPGAAWLRSLETETSKHAIAVAAATAAAADAAVAAAHAAVAVVRLTSHGGGIERLAAIKIQTLFRGYLARRALRALKALVKLQALVRGYLIRKEAAAALHSVEALMRAQAAALGQKSELEWGPKIVEIDTGSRRLPLTPERRCSFTAQNTPRLPKSPNYMSKTRASEARTRAHSAPRQRPEMRGRIPLGELLIEQSRPSLAFPTTHRSCSDAFSFKSAVVGRLDRSLECARDYSAKGFYFEKKR